MSIVSRMSIVPLAAPSRTCAYTRYFSNVSECFVGGFTYFNYILTSIVKILDDSYSLRPAGNTPKYNHSFNLINIIAYFK
jgi:hypothetical protein